MSLNKKKTKKKSNAAAMSMIETGNTKAAELAIIPLALNAT